MRVFLLALVLLGGCVCSPPVYMKKAKDAPNKWRVNGRAGLVGEFICRMENTETIGSKDPRNGDWDLVCWPKEDSN